MAPPRPSIITHVPRKKRSREHDQVGENCSNSGDEASPACQSCRKRKARCSRQQPCSQCQRLAVNCTYDERHRPGMRTGAIEALNQRLSALENMFIGQGLLLKPLLAHNSCSTSNLNVDIDGDKERDNTDAGIVPVTEQAARLKQQYLDTISNAWHAEDGSHRPVRPSLPAPHTTIVREESLDADHLLPSEDILESLVEWYMNNVHRWIPILHIRNFQQTMQVRPRNPGVNNILLAITSLGLKFQRPRDAETASISLRCRHSVILRSMEQFSVENLQALVIVAFDIIASGRSPSAWSIVGSMARTVEQLWLSREDSLDETSSKSVGLLMRRMDFLRPAKTWVEEEERRRVFWTVFIMDRFCSIATGWNNSLTCVDVQRRLPCEGALWEAETRVETPFFGIAEPSSKSRQPVTATSERRCTNEDEVDAIGGFAFCIEATETLNLVTGFFLEHAVSFKDPRGAQLWLIRFRELDLRLIKWRSFLPPKWRNASVFNQDGVMDPNLTLAHITHNTAVIQLHQSIAFPLAEWGTEQVSLPSAGSLDTCVTAACEIGSISHQFLQYNTGVTSPQLSFCLFIAGRMLLVHSISARIAIHPAFDIISSALAETARLWTAPDSAKGYTVLEESLASRLSRRLISAKDALHLADGTASRPKTLDIRQSVYCEDFEPTSATILNPNGAGNGLLPQSSQFLAHTYNFTSESPSLLAGNPPDSMSMAFPPLPTSFQQPVSSVGGYEPNTHALAEHLDENAFDGLEGLFDSQYEQAMRVSVFGNQAAIGSSSS